MVSLYIARLGSESVPRLQSAGAKKQTPMTPTTQVQNPQPQDQRPKPTEPYLTENHPGDGPRVDARAHRGALRSAWAQV